MDTSIIPPIDITGIATGFPALKLLLPMAPDTATTTRRTQGADGGDEQTEGEEAVVPATGGQEGDTGAMQLSQAVYSVLED
jgi:hypothetical protein